MDGGNYKIFDFDESDHSIEEPNSNFNQHRREVIKYSIEKNLSAAISNFNNYTGSTNNFQMPKLKETEWDKLINHISIISFLQGLNIGGKVYNGYSIITNTKNKEVVSEDSIYILSEEDSGQLYYHNVTENELKSDAKKTLQRGILNIDLERRSITGQNKFYFPINALGSYSSVVNPDSTTDTDNIYKYLDDAGNDEVRKLYYTALGRERYSMYRGNNEIK